jgi:hypothetical protein
MNINCAIPKAARAAALVFWATAAFAGVADPVYKDGSGQAIRGYDPVAYFTESKPVKGSERFTFPWMGATWKFSSAANRDEFMKDPMHYSPQYGGYCSYAVSQGHTASIDPEAWRIVDGKLYLNYSKGIQTSWQQDVQGYIQKANRNWPDLHK